MAMTAPALRSMQHPPTVPSPGAHGDALLPPKHPEVQCHSSMCAFYSSLSHGNTRTPQPSLLLTLRLVPPSSNLEPLVLVSPLLLSWY